ncbi:hypothetical protein PROFUN_13748 [Planoprotostelium fungivorum]|uniref:Uncharacterized protein n=1 Tax=Planoprotostelium fungivorum TaxID=1890364 RepID=A0A2P6N339_9EUKA|nr:hypothetical protein PROFUN_13748 [Planoprotostelium fungivorum]
MILLCKIVEVPLAISSDLFLAFSISQESREIAVGLIWQDWSTAIVARQVCWLHDLDIIAGRCDPSESLSPLCPSFFLFFFGKKKADEEDPNTGRQRPTRACDAPLGYSSARSQIQGVSSCSANCSADCLRDALDGSVTRHHLMQRKERDKRTFITSRVLKAKRTTRKM